MAKPRRSADAVVIGGGPSGALAALHLARLGWRTMLVEKGGRKRDKPCGDCLNRRAINALHRAGIGETLEGTARGMTQRFRAHVPVSHSRGEGMSLDVPMRAKAAGDAGGFVVDRGEFDQMLRDHAEAAGVEMIQPASARLLWSDRDVATVEVHTSRQRYQIECNLVIGADGLGSAVARATGLVHKRSAGRRYGFSFDAVNPMAAAVERGTIEMFLAPLQSGYMGVVNCGGGVLHVAGLVDGHADPASRAPLNFVLQTARSHALLRKIGFDRMPAGQMQHLKAIGPMPWLPWKVASGALVLAGDAAGYIDQFTGEGMGWAIESAELIGQVAANCSNQRWTAAASHQYDAAWRQTVVRRQLICRALMWALARPRITTMMMRIGERLPWIAQRVAAEVVAA
jgi:flavin-dependent dehydrogenase